MRQRRIGHCPDIAQLVLRTWRRARRQFHDERVASPPSGGQLPYRHKPVYSPGLPAEEPGVLVAAAKPPDNGRQMWHIGPAYDQQPTVMVSVVRELACPASRAISSTATPDSDMTKTNVCRSSRGAHTPSMPAFLHKARKSRRTWEASSDVPTLLVNTRPESCHSSPAASRASAWRLRCSRSAVTALCGKASVRRDFSVLVSPCRRTERHTATCGGTGGRVSGLPSRSKWSRRSALASSVRMPVVRDRIT